MDSFEAQKEPRLRFANSTDAPEIVRMIKELAEYEKEPDSVTATPEELAKQMESNRPPFECILVEVEGKAVGFALFFPNYSTWQGKPGMYLEDLYVQPDQRGGGVGKKLLHRLADICRERGYGRMEWQVLSWNQPAIDFYQSIGAQPLDEWKKYRISGDALQSL
ncbi:GNAT family N-acetyltransferase [Candidatus Kaiserbacteria bacterium CG10_big_fil_rev_8_21_14_0_10_51_14]|uniref:GNAT family N-acetyltransferase n=1 Tax=Candidatus Kaiserbacteria bacterium CG10_big_fil_rev_8_21_14_0_10_51_14 TaxID=1974610 RepID=A0A2H0UBP0_9BACT|nr:MAG: GNAT family N-acetyltransferase [Candidatus Kaiserbacteria bacterium CG10_big_fil_rev_8_21_14_0_10_51_14]